jgi:hypothetical protein
VEHFEDNDDNDNDSDDVEDVSVHGSWITLRCALRQAIIDENRAAAARFPTAPATLIANSRNQNINGSGNQAIGCVFRQSS